MTQQKLTQEELEDIIDEHSVFMFTNGESGKKGDLTEKDIRHLKFDLGDLEGMIRTNAKIR